MASWTPVRCVEGLPDERDIVEVSESVTRPAGRIPRLDACKVLDVVGPADSVCDRLNVCLMC